MLSLAIAGVVHCAVFVCKTKPGQCDPHPSLLRATALHSIAASRLFLDLLYLNSPGHSAKLWGDAHFLVCSRADLLGQLFEAQVDCIWKQTCRESTGAHLVAISRDASHCASRLASIHSKKWEALHEL